MQEEVLFHRLTCLFDERDDLLQVVPQVQTRHVTRRGKEWLPGATRRFARHEEGPPLERARMFERSQGSYIGQERLLCTRIFHKP